MSAWKLFPHLIVRATGFPFEWEERLGVPRSFEAAQRVVRAKAAIEAYRADSPRLTKLSRGVLAALKACRPVREEQTDNFEQFATWNRLAGEVQDALAVLEESLAPELAETQKQLRDMGDDARFQEAVASSSPPVFQDIRRGRWNSRLERQLASYVQRLASKNETMSFFGPINYGETQEGGADGVSLEWSGPLVLKARRAHVAYWVVQQLVHHIAFDPEIGPSLVPTKRAFIEPPIARTHRRIGELLVEKGLLTSMQLQEVLARQLAQRRLLGDLLVESAWVSREAIEEVLRQQSVSRGASTANLTELLVRGADGRRSINGLAAQLEVEVPLLLETFRAACEKRLLTHQLEVPSSIGTPLENLVERLAGIPGPAARRHLEGVTEILRRMRVYSSADAFTKVVMNDQLRQFVEERWNIRSPLEAPAAAQASTAAPRPTAAAPTEAPVSPAADVTASSGAQTAPPPGEESSPRNAGAETRGSIAASGNPPSSPRTAAAPAATDAQRRGEGQHFYVDRLPMREECGGDMQLTLSGERAREISRMLEPSLDVLAAAAVRTRNASRLQLAKLLGSRTIPFWKVAVAYSDRPVPFDNSLSEWMKGQCSSDVRHVELEGRTVPPSPKDASPIICSVDLLVCARDVESWAKGDYRVVMGDIHDTPLVWGWALQFHPKRTEVELDMVAAMGALDRPVPVVSMMASRRTGLLPSEFPGPVIELGGVSGRASSWKLPLDDLIVVSTGETAQLISQSLGGEVELYNGELDSLVHSAFSLPRIRPPRVDLGAHTPRVTFGGVILQREQWTLTDEQTKAIIDAEKDKDRLLYVAELWNTLGLPRYVFAKFPNERKPILVDPASPLNLRVLANLLKHRGGGLFSEMMPGPEELWLKHPGGRHTSELRACFLRSGNGA